MKPQLTGFLPIKVSCNSSFDFLLELLNITISCVDPDISAKRVGDNNGQLFPQHCAGDDALVLPIVKSIADTTILPIMDWATSGLPDPCQNMRVLADCQDE